MLIEGPRNGIRCAEILDDIDYVIVALFVLVWVAAVAHWHLGNVEQRWSRRLAREEPPPT